TKKWFLNAYSHPNPHLPSLSLPFGLRQTGQPPRHKRRRRGATSFLPGKSSRSQERDRRLRSRSFLLLRPPPLAENLAVDRARCFGPTALRPCEIHCRSKREPHFPPRCPA